VTLLDRFIAWVAPKWGESRARARMMVRHFESAAAGRRTDGWSRRLTDANAAASGQALGLLRAQARDLVRNNPWARRGLRRITANTVGWGIRPKATGVGADRVMQLWKKWGETTECDAAGRLTFYGLQRLIMRTVVESGEVLVRRRSRLRNDGLSIPLQLQVLEPDFIDTGRDGIIGEAGGPLVQGVEFDKIGRRAAYWLFDRHPGSIGTTIMLSAASRRVPADQILHIYDQERAGQVRGPSWFAPVDVRLHEFHEYEDATLMKQKIASCMAAFVTDNGENTPFNEPGTDAVTGQITGTFEPGMILPLAPGKEVTIANPPQASDHQSFSATALRGVAAGLGTTYEDLTGDYSQVNYSSARMAQNAHYRDVDDWRWNMIIPQFCVPAWQWMLDALLVMGLPIEDSPADWTPPPRPMLDPDKEGQANSRMIRAGQMTHDEMVREQGYDPDVYWKEYAAGLKRLDKLGIVLDSDPRKTTAAGQAQIEPAAAGASPAAPIAAKPPSSNGVNGTAKPTA
jgi:lambda family phage portal protein